MKWFERSLIKLVLLVTCNETAANMLRANSKKDKFGTAKLELQKTTSSLAEELDIATLNERLGEELSLEQIQKKITFHMSINSTQSNF